jgi:hypothetical protein
MHDGVHVGSFQFFERPSKCLRGTLARSKSSSVRRLIAAIAAPPGPGASA